MRQYKRDTQSFKVAEIFIGRTLKIRHVGFSSRHRGHFSSLCHTVSVQLRNDDTTQVSIPPADSLPSRECAFQGWTCVRTRQRERQLGERHSIEKLKFLSPEALLPFKLVLNTILQMAKPGLGGDQQLAMIEICIQEILVSTFSMPGTELNAENSAVNKSDWPLSLWS